MFNLRILTVVWLYSEFNLIILTFKVGILSLISFIPRIKYSVTQKSLFKSDLKDDSYNKFAFLNSWEEIPSNFIVLKTSSLLQETFK